MSATSNPLRGSLTICKDSSGTVRVYVRDQESRTVFAALRLSPEDFADALFGLAETHCELDVHGLDRIGKRRVSESRQIEVLGEAKIYKRDNLRAWLRENAQEPGWILDDYLGTQGSVLYRDGKVLLNYRVYKFVDVAEESAAAVVQGSCDPDCEWGARKDGDPVGQECQKCGLIIPF